MFLCFYRFCHTMGRKCLYFGVLFKKKVQFATLGRVLSRTSGEYSFMIFLSFFHGNMATRQFRLGQETDRQELAWWGGGAKEKQEYFFVCCICSRNPHQKCPMVNILP
mmetsp:Transcript_128927/g.222790  ORF Transcript_128927/g.222790 Transcript_128927/m.222790 type:complete len:108 (-) Transcript_128927:326-649(-)